MKAVVLAAGLGKRLAAVTSQTPKVLVKIGNKTLIEHNVDKLRKIGINKIALVIGYKGEMVKEVLGGSLTYYEQRQQLGTAHAFLCAQDFINEPYFLGMNGDMFFIDPLADFIKLKPAVVAVYHVEDTRRYGRIEIKAGRLVSIKEKINEEAPGFVNAGVYLFPKQVFDWIRKTPLSSRKEYEITDTIQMMINQGLQFTIYELKDFWTDIAYLSDLKEARSFVNKKR
jgi:dTDP-glucose pyrophosphorylase